MFDLSDSQTVVNEFIKKYGLDTSLITDVQAEIDSYTDFKVKFEASDTNFLISASSDIAAEDLLLIDNELVAIQSISANNVVVKRGQLSTIADSHLVNTDIKLIKHGVTTTTIEGTTFLDSDNTLTVTSTDGFSSDDYIRIDNEILRISKISENNLTVTRAELSTIKANHDNGANVTILNVRSKILSVTATIGNSVITDDGATDRDYFTSSGNKITVTSGKISAIKSPGKDDYTSLENQITNRLVAK